MRTTLNAKKQNKPFPRLMQYRDGSIVYFEEERRGTVLYSIGFLRLGYDIDFAMEEFSDFEGSITLENDI